MGSDPIALPFLRSLTETFPQLEMVGVFTQPDRPKGRGQKLQANEIKRWAQEATLPVRQPERCRAEDEKWLREQAVDLILVMAFGQILKASLIEIPRIGTFNLHASLLPKLRGASPIHTAIASGDSKTGVSLMRIIPALDAGPYCAQEEVEITPQLTAPELIQRIATASRQLIARALPAVLTQSAVWTEQAPQDVTYCRRIFKEDAGLDFRKSARELDQRIRAFQPWPGSLIDYQGIALKIGSAEVTEATGQAPGTLQVLAGTITIACGEGALRIQTLQRPGGKMLPSEAFLHGFELQNGATVSSVAMAPLVARKPFPWKWRPGDEMPKIV